MQVRLLPSRVARVALAWALLAPSACQLLMKPSGASAVAQGRYYSTGNPEYDTFFIELHRLQVELKDAPDRAAEPRRDLAQALDVGIDTSVIKEALGKKASELGAHQVKFAVARPASSDKPLTLQVTGSPSGDDAALKKTLEETLAKISELRTATDGWQKSLEPLPEREAKLESGLDAAFDDPRKRAEVKGNLSDGRKIIDLLVTRAKDTEQSNGELLDAITGALGEAPAASGEKTGESEASTPSRSSEKKAHKSSAPPPKPPKPAKSARAESKPPAPKPAPKPAATPPKPPEPKPAEAKPAAKPAEPKPERSEVPPAPKPTQGTAKPDFEP